MPGSLDDVVTNLRRAIEALDAAEVPSDLREVAFGRVFDLLAGSMDRAGTGEPASTGPVRLGEFSAPARPAAAISERSASIARELELEGEMIERLFDEHGPDELQFIGTLERFGTTKQSMVESVAILLCAARSAGGYDPDGRTPDAVIRAEIERHGLYDVTNYSKHTKRLRQLANPNGSGRSTTYKLKYEGRIRARELARTSLGLS